MTLGSDRGPSRLIDPFPSSRKGRYITGGVVGGLIGLVVVSNVFGGTGIKAKVTYTHVFVGAIQYTAEVHADEGRPVDLSCYVNFTLVSKDGVVGGVTDQFDLQDVEGTVSSAQSTESFNGQQTLAGDPTIDCSIASTTEGS